MTLSTTKTKTSILLIATEQPEVAKASVFLQNWTLPELLENQGAAVTIKCWRDQDVLEFLEGFDSISFLWCNDYHTHAGLFLSFLDHLEEATKDGGYGPRVVNDVEVIRWNADKSYLLEMEKGGFQIPRTRILDAGNHSISELKRIICDFKPSGPVILKPSMSSSSQMTWHIKDTSAFTHEDVEFLELCGSGNLRSALVVQNFEASIAAGEMSFVFIGGKLTNIILKTPKQGEFRCQIEFEGSETPLKPSEIPEKTWETVLGLLRYLDERFNSGKTRKMEYLRIDGLVADDRPFVLMEIEAIEPHLWLETGKGVDELLSIFLPHMSPANE